MKRRLLILAIVVTIAATAIALLIGMVGAAQEETSRVRLAHAVPGSLTVDVEVDGTPVYTDVAYKDVTVYTELPAGTHTVSAKVLGFSLDQTVYLTGGIDATVIGVGKGLSIDPIGLEDDNRLSNANTVRVVHLAPDLATMDVTLTGTMGTTEIGALPYKEAGDYVGGLGAGEVVVEVRSGGAIKALDPPTATLQEDAIHTLFIMGYGETLDLVAVIDREFDEVHTIFLPLVIEVGAGG